jgi:hypothetical protein
MKRMGISIQGLHRLAGLFKTSENLNDRINELSKQIYHESFDMTKKYEGGFGRWIEDYAMNIYNRVSSSNWTNQPGWSPEENNELLVIEIQRALIYVNGFLDNVSDHVSQRFGSDVPEDVQRLISITEELKVQLGYALNDAQYGVEENTAYWG